MTDTTDTPTTEAPAAPKKPRRRLTPEQRIAEREAEIAKIKEKCRERVRDTIDELSLGLRLASDRATEAGMTDAVARIDAAIKALGVRS
jgi:hypothetical protein